MAGASSSTGTSGSSGGASPPGSGGAPPPGSGVPIAPTLFLTDPYEGDINPSEQNGFKLFLKATKERESADRIDVTQGNATEFLSKMSLDSSDFGWGALVHRIDIDDSGTNKKSLLRDYKDIKLEHVKQVALRTWGNKAAVFTTPFPAGNTMYVETIHPDTTAGDRIIFFQRVRSRMIAKRIRGSITDQSWNSLLTKKKHFQWTKTDGDIEHDGPTM